MNGYTWCMRFVPSNSSYLVDRTRHYRIAVTDPATKTIYISAAIQEDMLPRVLLHELTHCAFASYDILPNIHRIVKKRYWVEAEEIACNFVADHGRELIDICDRLAGRR